MKKSTIFGTAIAVAFLLNVSITNATVGGPTLIHSLQYSSSKPQEIIFEAQNYGGKGCPPEIFSLDLNTGAIKTVVDCDDVDWDLAQNGYNAKLEYTLSQYPSLLRHIDLNINNITAEVTVTGEEKYNPNAGFFGRTDYRLDVFQNGVKKGSYNYSGCSVDQPHVIEGYTVPNTRNLVLLVSSKGDCFEGGYAVERLFVVPNVTFSDIKSLPLKGSKEASPGPGNLYLMAKPANVPLMVNTAKPTMKPSQTPIIQSPAVNDTVSNPLPGSSDSFSYLFVIGALVLIILVLILKKR